MVINRDIEECINTAREFGARRIILFGSALTSRETARDIDLIIDGVSEWDSIRLGALMEDRISVPVDIICGDNASAFTDLNRTRGKILYEA